MSDHTYTTGDKVERISTGVILKYRKRCTLFWGDAILVETCCIEDGTIGVWWPASDCRPAIDPAVTLAAKDARIEWLEQKLSDKQRVVEAYRKRESYFEQKLAASAERETKLRKLCGTGAGCLLDAMVSGDKCDGLGFGDCTCKTCSDSVNCAYGSAIVALRAAEGGE